jgi:hypothetical protein
MDGKMTPMFWVAFLVFATLFSVVIAFYVDTLKSSATQNEKLLGVVGGTVSSISLVVLGLTLYAFGGNPNRMIQFLYVVALLVILPVGMISAAVSANHLYGLREAVAVKKA